MAGTRIFSIQYASNLFLHKNSSWKQAIPLLTPGKAPNLALLGNIGHPHSEKTKNFIRWCCDNWDQVYAVPGPCELVSESRLNGLFKNLPPNLHMLDQVEANPDPNLVLLGCPLWTGYAEELKSYRSLSEEDRSFLANQPIRTIENWHDEDIEFLVERIRSNQASYGGTLKMILLTHHVPHRHFLPSSAKDRERQIHLHDGNIRHLLTRNVLGCLSGSGGGSVTGFLGKYKSFCGVNAAFQGPTMVPNPQFRPDMTASFPIDAYPLTPEASPSSNGKLSLIDFLPRPQLAVANAYPVLQ